MPRRLLSLMILNLKVSPSILSRLRTGRMIDLRTGEEGIDADIDGKAALDAADDPAIDHGTFFKSIPDPLTIGLLFGKRDQTVFVFGALKQDIDLVANFDVRSGHFRPQIRSEG